MPELVRNRHWRVVQDLARAVVRLERTREPFTSADDMNTSFVILQAALDRVGRARHGLLVDIRNSPLRTDPAFEVAFQRHRLQMLSGWARIAILVGTAVGKLQVQRHTREDKLDAQVFDDEPAALAFAASHEMLRASLVPPVGAAPAPRPPSPRPRP